MALAKLYILNTYLKNSCRALGATIVTVPSLYYLMQPQLERLNRPKGHGRGGHEGHSEDDKHSKEPKGGEEGDPSEREEPVDETGEGQGGEAEQESQEGGKDEGKSEDSDTSDDESSGNVAHETGSGQDVEGVQFKGAASGGGDTRKHIPDAKGFNKKRIESDYANKQGEANKPEQDPNNEDLVWNICCDDHDGNELMKMF